MNVVDVTEEDCRVFPSGWSLTPFSVYTSFKHLTYNNQINVLEFGSGLSTHLIYNILNKLQIPFKYVVYEHDRRYATTKGVEYNIFDLSHQKFSSDIIFDFIIVDGPNGVNRYKWYEQFKNNVRSGTIILIDDFHHYREFGNALDEHFDYELISEFNIDSRFQPIINMGTDIVDQSDVTFHGTKTHKIVKVESVKR
jgi:hypothetical protein